MLNINYNNMEKKFTLGPWVAEHWVKVSNYGDIPTSLFAATDGRKVLIAEFGWLVFKNLTGEMAHANIQLMQAAPDLLEALETITAEYSAMIISEFSTDPDENPYVKAAKAAINKANGK